MDLTILANILQIHQPSKASLTDLMILRNFPHSGYCKHFWKYLHASDCTNIKLTANSLIFGYGSASL